MVQARVPAFAINRYLLGRGGKGRQGLNCWGTGKEEYRILRLGTTHRNMLGKQRGGVRKKEKKRAPAEIHLTERTVSLIPNTYEEAGSSGQGEKVRGKGKETSSPPPQSVWCVRRAEGLD